MIDAYPWAALAVAILAQRNITPDQAYDILETGQTKRIGWTDNDLKEMRDLREEGYTWQAIGDLFGVSAGSIWKAVKNGDARDARNAEKRRERQRAYMAQKRMGVVG